MVTISLFTGKKSEARARIDREADNQQLLQLEEKDVVSSVATVLSDLCGPGEWMPMAKLHAERTSPMNREDRKVSTKTERSEARLRKKVELNDEGVSDSDAERQWQ
ncbi:uncharacterized protein A4U43_C10F5330 [Asparagus officinalis]|uniref:Uncharacterized protein n=1 Tax=Asparagus officinalis TaxID=4686 RepID=A0A5P1E3Z8_ASPOF|nr:uncharacterized protein A4U43_C10F5330 [Asparagus officinalis]